MLPVPFLFLPIVAFFFLAVSVHFFSWLLSTKTPKEDSEEDNPYKDLTEEEKERLLKEWEKDSEDYGWGDPYEDDYDDDDYESWEEEEPWPEDERPTQSPRLNNPPRLSLSERKILYAKSNQGRSQLPWEDRRDFWAKLVRRDGLHPRQWALMEAHIEKYAPEWEKFNSELEKSKKKKGGAKS